MEFTYETIKDLAKQTGRPVTDFIVLAARNDPFYTGTPGETKLAEWFADFYHSKFAPGTRVHVRRCHYKILSLEMMLPDGKPYENTEECWNTLLMATKAARYLRLVDVGAFEDRKNDDPITYAGSNDTYPPEIAINDYLYTSDLELPEFPGLPSYRVDAYESAQPYRLELWCEKTTMNDILLPLCERYGMTLQTGAGELSITATKALADRIEQSGKPTRIFYISDYDPAGQSMPVAVARKLEWMLSNLPEADVRLFPIVLTADQVQQYRLPRTPIKESERRKDSFEARHGAGATELDALEALRPGELQRLLVRYIESYYDVSLEDRTRLARRELERDLEQTRREVLERYRDQIEARRQELQGIHTDFAPRMKAYSDQLEQLWLDISGELKEAAPDLNDYPLPEAKEAREIGSGLYSTDRNYLEQIDVYKQFQGK